MNGYRAMSVAEPADYLSDVSLDTDRWRIIAEFLEEYRHEPLDSRLSLLAAEPGPSGDAQWDVFLAALAEYVSARDGAAPPEWSYDRRLRSFWFPFDTPAARVDAVVNAPASFRSRGIFISPQELHVA